jgi:esterase
MLATTEYPATTPDFAADGSPDGAPEHSPPLLIVHGLFGSARNWGVIARHLADRRRVLAVDMRNHGSSPRAGSQSYADMAADLAEVIAAHGGRVDLLGHSMGGKAAMQLALTHPDMVRRLVIADIAPVAYNHDQSQHIQAMRGLDLTNLTSRGDADRRLAQTIADPALRAFFLQSLELKVQPPQWRLNLDVLEAEMPKIVGWPGTSGQFGGAALFLTGSESHYVKAEYREAIRALFPKARFAKLPGAGHWLHADRPREFEETVRVFLNA